MIMATITASLELTTRTALWASVVLTTTTASLKLPPVVITNLAMTTLTHGTMPTSTTLQLPLKKRTKKKTRKRMRNRKMPRTVRMQESSTLATMVLHGEVILRLTLGQKQEPALMSILITPTEAHTEVLTVVPMVDINIISLNMKSLKLTKLIHGASSTHLSMVAMELHRITESLSPSTSITALLSSLHTRHPSRNPTTVSPTTAKSQRLSEPGQRTRDLRRLDIVKKIHGPRSNLVHMLKNQLHHGPRSLQFSGMKNQETRTEDTALRSLLRLKEFRINTRDHRGLRDQAMSLRDQASRDQATSLRDQASRDQATSLTFQASNHRGQASRLSDLSDPSINLTHPLMALIASSLPGAQTATKLPLSAPAITLRHPSAGTALVTSARREMTPATLAAMDPTVARTLTPHLARPRLV